MRFWHLEPVSLPAHGEWFRCCVWYKLLFAFGKKEWSYTVCLSNDCVLQLEQKYFKDILNVSRGYWKRRKALMWGVIAMSTSPPTPRLSAGFSCSVHNTLMKYVSAVSTPPCFSVLSLPPMAEQKTRQTAVHCWSAKDLLPHKLFINGSNWMAVQNKKTHLMTIDKWEHL